jgi:hypothetical protein
VNICNSTVEDVLGKMLDTSLTGEKAIGEQDMACCFASLIGNSSANDLLREGQRHGLRVALRLPPMTMK